MSEPIHHQLAQGIHPGAFVQPGPPDTGAIQNGTLWVDTSVGPPCPLRFWDAVARLWRDTDTQATLDQIVTGAGDPGTTLTQTLGPQGITPTWQTPCGAANCVDVPPLPTNNDGAVSTDQSRCGAALAMANYLGNVYNKVADILDSGISTLVGLGIDGALSLLEGLFLGPEGTVVGFPLQLPPLILLAKFLIGPLLPGVSDLDTSQNLAILQAAYQSLDGGSRSIIVTQATIDTWGRRMWSNPALAVPEPQNLLGLILAVPMLSVWQALAFKGAHQGTGVCAGFPVPSHSMSGGAVLGRSTVSRVLRGGAFMGMTGHRSMRGGGYYFRPTGQSLSGGASAT